jgi:preprotein translocase subunit SecD
MTATTPGSRPAAGALVAIGVGVLLLIALVIAAIVVTPALLATPPRATLTVTVTGPDGSPVDATGRQDAAAVLAGRLDAADIPNSLAAEGADVVVRIPAEATDAQVESARSLLEFSTAADFREVLATGACVDGEPPAPTESGEMSGCDADGSFYELGSVVLDGSAIADARSLEPQGAATGQWVVQLTFDDEGAADFADATAELAAAGGQFAVLVDGEVIVAPQVMVAITDGNPQISGSFAREAAEFLAARLRLAAYDATLAVSAVDVAG